MRSGNNLDIIRGNFDTLGEGIYADVRGHGHTHYQKEAVWWD